MGSSTGDHSGCTCLHTAWRFGRAKEGRTTLSISELFPTPLNMGCGPILWKLLEKQRSHIGEVSGEWLIVITTKKLVLEENCNNMGVPCGILTALPWEELS